jgi:secondary thiamine-phosphate synthase enzyme
MEEIIIRTNKSKEVLDITNEVERVIKEKGIEAGICHLFCLHTTAALLCADLDPGTDLDMLDAFDVIVPALRYRHAHNPLHVKDHIMASIIGASVCVPIDKGELVLGPWQRVCLAEFGGPRERNVVVSLTSVVQ